MTGGYYSKDDARLVLRTVQYLLRSGFIIDPSGPEGQFVPPDAPIYIRNGSGEEIPAFAIVQVTGTVEDGGQNYIIVQKPDTSDPGKFLFNGISPVGIDGNGIAYAGPLVRVLTDGSSYACGDDMQVTNGQWHATAGAGVLSAVGDDDIEADVARALYMPIDTVTVSVVTDVRVSGNNLQYKTRTITVLSADTESDWTTWHTGTECPP